VFSQTVHKMLLYSHDYYIVLKYNIGIWVQFRKEDQILRLDLNSYRVIFKLLTFLRSLWDPGTSVRDLYLMRVLGAVLRVIRCVSPHQHSEQGSWLWLIGYWVFIWEIFAIHSDEVSSTGVRRCTLLYILDYILFYIIVIIIFILKFILFYLFSLPYARFVVRTWRD
jgi:hypothetical protein